MAISLFFLMWEDHMDKSAAWTKLYSLFLWLCRIPGLNCLKYSWGLEREVIIRKQRKKARKEGGKGNKEERKKKRERKRKNPSHTRI